MAKPPNLKRPRGRLTVRNVEKALRSAAGIQSGAAQMLQVDRSTVCRFVQKHPKLNAVINEIADAVLDLAESKLIENIGNNDTRSITYYLDHKGQSRGYGIRKTAFADGQGTVHVAATMVLPAVILDDYEWEAHQQLRLAQEHAASLDAIEDATMADASA